jgi:hypothetical protein
MLEQFSTLHPVLQALLATCFTWLMSVSASSCFFCGLAGAIPRTM